MAYDAEACRHAALRREHTLFFVTRQSLEDTHAAARPEPASSRACRGVEGWSAGVCLRFVPVGLGEFVYRDLNHTLGFLLFPNHFSQTLYCVR